MNVIWSVITTNIDDYGEREVLVINIDDNYWVKCGNIINTIAVGELGFTISGIGSKNYRKDIFNVIMIFREKIIREKQNWGFKDKKNIKVLRSDINEK